MSPSKCPLRFVGETRTGRAACGAGYEGETAEALAARLSARLISAEITDPDGRLVGGIGVSLDTGESTWWGEG